MSRFYARDTFALTVPYTSDYVGNVSKCGSSAPDAWPVSRACAGDQAYVRGPQLGTQRAKAVGMPTKPPFENCSFRLHEKQADLLVRAAKKAAVDGLSEWLRSRAVAAAAAELGEPEPEVPPIGRRHTSAPPAPDLESPELSDAVQRAAASLGMSPAEYAARALETAANATLDAGVSLRRPPSGSHRLHLTPAQRVAK